MFSVFLWADCSKLSYNGSRTPLEKGYFMSTQKSVWLCALAVLLSMLIFQGCEKRAADKQAGTEQVKALAEQVKKVAEQVREFPELSKRLAELDEKLAELDNKVSVQAKQLSRQGQTGSRLDKMEAEVETLKSGGVNYDTSAMQKTIEEQVRLNVRKAEPARLGVVSIQRAFLECKRNAKYMERAEAEQRSLEAELNKLRKEIEAAEAGLRTLKAGSPDRLSQVKELLDKRAEYETQQKFFKFQIELKDQQWSEQLYRDILRRTGEVAKEKGLDLVLEMSEPSFPAGSAEELRLTIRTHKLLYGGVCQDITEEVMARLDVEEKDKEKGAGAAQ